MSRQRKRDAICTGAWAVMFRAGVLVRNGPDGGELMIYGLEVEAKAKLPKGCTLQRVDVFPSAATVVADGAGQATPRAGRCITSSR